MKTKLQAMHFMCHSRYSAIGNQTAAPSGHATSHTRLSARSGLLALLAVVLMAMMPTGAEAQTYTWNFGDATDIVNLKAAISNEETIWSDLNGENHTKTLIYYSKNIAKGTFLTASDLKANGQELNCLKGQDGKPSLALGNSPNADKELAGTYGAGFLFETGPKILNFRTGGRNAIKIPKEYLTVNGTITVALTANDFNIQSGNIEQLSYTANSSQVFTVKGTTEDVVLVANTNNTKLKTITVAPPSEKKTLVAAFSADYLTKTVEGGVFASPAISVTSPSGFTNYTVTYSISSTAVATIDTSTGQVTPVAKGNATVTAHLTVADAVASEFESSTKDITYSLSIGNKSEWDFSSWDFTTITVGTLGIGTNYSDFKKNEYWSYKSGGRVWAGTSTESKSKNTEFQYLNLLGKDMTKGLRFWDVNNGRSGNNNLCVVPGVGLWWNSGTSGRFSMPTIADNTYKITYNSQAANKTVGFSNITNAKEGKSSGLTKEIATAYDGTQSGTAQFTATSTSSTFSLNDGNTIIQKIQELVKQSPSFTLPSQIDQQQEGGYNLNSYLTFVGNNSVLTGAKESMTSTDDYTVSYEISNTSAFSLTDGVLKVVTAGQTATLTVTVKLTEAGRQKYCFADGAITWTQNYTVTGINSANTVVISHDDPGTLQWGDKKNLNASATAEAEPTLTYASSDETVVKVANDGTVYALRSGTATVTITATPTNAAYVGAANKAVTVTVEAPASTEYHNGLPGTWDFTSYRYGDFGTNAAASWAFAGGSENAKTAYQYAPSDYKDAVSIIDADGNDLFAGIQFKDGSGNGIKTNCLSLFFGTGVTIQQRAGQIIVPTTPGLIIKIHTTSQATSISGGDVKYENNGSDYYAIVIAKGNSVTADYASNTYYKKVEVIGFDASLADKPLQAYFADKGKEIKPTDAGVDGQAPTVAELFSADALTAGTDYTVSYASGNELIVTVDPTTGALTAKGAHGDVATITATITLKGGYSGRTVNTATYKVTINDTELMNYSTWDFTTLKAEHFNGNDWWATYSGHYGNKNSYGQNKVATPENIAGKSLLNGLTIKNDTDDQFTADRFRMYEGVGLGVNSSDAKYKITIPTTKDKMYRFTYAAANLDDDNVDIGIMNGISGGSVVEGSGSLNVKANKFSNTDTERKSVIIKATGSSLTFSLTHTRTRLAKIEEIELEPEGPAFDPESGDFGTLEGLTVTMTSAFDGVTIRYKKTETADKPTFDAADGTWLTGNTFTAGAEDYGTFYIHAVITKGDQVSDVATGGPYTYRDNMPAVSYSPATASINIAELPYTNIPAADLLPTLTKTNVDGNDALTVEYTSTNEDVAKFWGTDLHIKATGTTTITVQVKKDGSTLKSASYELTVTGAEGGATYDETTNTLTFDKPGVLATHTFNIGTLNLAFTDQEETTMLNDNNTAVVGTNGLRLIDANGFSHTWMSVAETPAPIQGSFYVLKPSADGMLYLNGTLEADGEDTGTKLKWVKGGTDVEDVTIDVANGILTADLTYNDRDDNKYFLYNAGGTPLQLKSISYQERPATPVITDAGGTDITGREDIEYYNKAITVTATPATGTKLWYKWGTGVADEEAIRSSHTEKDGASDVTLTGLYVQRTLTAYSVKEVGDMKILSEPVHVTFQLQKEDYFTFDYEETGDQSSVWEVYDNSVTTTEKSGASYPGTTPNSYGSYPSVGSGSRSVAYNLSEVSYGGADTYFVEFDLMMENNTSYENNHEFVLLGEAPVKGTNKYDGADKLFGLDGKGKSTDWTYTDNGETKTVTLNNNAWYHFNFTISEDKTLRFTILNADGTEVVSGSNTFTTDNWQLKGLRMLLNRESGFSFDNLKIQGIAPRIQAPVISTVDDATEYAYNQDFPVTITQTVTGSTLLYAYTTTSRKPSLSEDVWTEIASGESVNMKNYGDFYIHAVAQITEDGITETSHVTTSGPYTFTPPSLPVPTLARTDGGADSDGVAAITQQEFEEDVMTITLTGTKTDDISTIYSWTGTQATAETLTLTTGTAAAEANTTFYYQDESDDGTWLNARTMYVSGNGHRYYSDVVSLKMTSTAIDGRLQMVNWTYSDESTTARDETVGGVYNTTDSGDGIRHFTNPGTGDRYGQIYLDGKAKVNNTYYVEFDTRINIPNNYAGDFELSVLAESRGGNFAYAFSEAEKSDNKVRQDLFRLTGHKEAGSYTTTDNRWYANVIDPNTAGRSNGNNFQSVNMADTVGHSYLTMVNEQWYHVKLVVNKEKKALNYVIRQGKGKNGTVYAKGYNTFTGTGVAQVIRFVMPRGNDSEYFDFDNVEVWGKEPEQYLFYVTDAIDGELTDLSFDEPAFASKPNLDQFYEDQIVYSSDNPRVALFSVDTIDDLMFVNTGVATIWATLYKHNEEHTEANVISKDSYEVTVKADDAGYNTSGNTYTLTSIGKLNERAVLSVPGIEMYFGNEQNYDLTAAEKLQKENGGDAVVNTTIVRKDPTSGVFVSSTIETRGWRNFRPVIAKDDEGNNLGETIDYEWVDKPVLPLFREGEQNLKDRTYLNEGSYYRFEPQTSGHLSFKGIRNNDNSVVLYNATDNKFVIWDASASGYKEVDAFVSDGASGYRVSGDFSEDIQKSYKELTLAAGESKLPIVTDGLVEVKEIPLQANKRYYLYGNVPFTGGYHISVKQQERKQIDGVIYTVWEKEGTTYLQSQKTMKVYPLGDDANSFVPEPQNVVKAGTEGMEKKMKDSNDSREQWSTFQLNSFTFNADFYFDNQGVVAATMKEVSSKAQTVNGTGLYKYEMKAYGNIQATINSSTGEISNVKGTEEDSDLNGGALIITATDTHGYSTSYAITVPYKYHRWNMSQDESEEHMTELRNATPNWSIAYKVREYEDVTRALKYLNMPVMCNSLSVDGENALYFPETAGLLIHSDAKNVGVDVSEILRSTNTYGEYNGTLVTPQDYVNLYAADKKLSASDPEYVKMKDFALKTMLNYKRDDVEKPHLLTASDNCTITIPDVRAGSFVTLYLNRYHETHGAKFKFTNLETLDGVDATTDEFSKKFTITGVLDTGGGKGGYVFRVPKGAGEDENTLKTVTIRGTQEGTWYDVYAIEVSPGKTSDLGMAYQVELTDKTNKVADVNSVNASVVYRTAPTAANPTTFRLSRGSAYVKAPRTSPTSFEISSDVFKVEIEDHADGDVATSKIKVASSRSVDLSDWCETFKITGYKDENVKYGNVLVTMNIYDETGTYLVDRIQKWFAVGSLDTHSYPVTWDFTNRNMTKTPATSALATKLPVSDDPNGHKYGEWAADNKVSLSYTVPDIDGKEIDKPTFASGAALTGGSDGKTVIAESEGLGVGLIETLNEDGTPKTVQLKYGSLSDDASDGDDGYLYFESAGYLTVPDFTWGGNATNPNCIFVKADHEPTVSDGSKTVEQDGDKRTMFSITGSDIYVYSAPTGKGTYDYTISFPAGTKVYKVAVSPRVKTIDNTAGILTQSRNEAIDYKQTQDFTASNVKVYYIDGISSLKELENEDRMRYIELTEITDGAVGANTGVILKCEGNPEAETTPTARKLPLFFPPVNVESPVYAGEEYPLKAHLSGNVPGCTSEVYTYLLTNKYHYDWDNQTTNVYTGDWMFYRTNGGLMTSNTAYLQLPAPTAGSAAARSMVLLSFPWDVDEPGDDPDDVTAVGGITTDGPAAGDQDGDYYTLNGLKIQGKPTKKGIYVKNGKKVIIK